MEWTKVNLMDGLWKDALSAACDVSIALPTIFLELTQGLKFKVPRLTTYRTLCEGLEMADGIMDAVECYHQMAGELAEEIITRGEQAKWFLSEQLCMLCVWCL